MRASSLPPSLAHLPNAAPIDWVLQSVKQNPALWNAAWDAARGAAWVAARGAVAALVAWDHAGPVLHMSDEAFAGALALDPHLVLLVPARHILKQEKK